MKKDLLAKWICGIKAQWNLNTNSSQSTVTPRPRGVKNWKKKKKDTLLRILEKIFVGCLKNQKIFNEIQERFLGRKPSFERGKRVKRPRKGEKKNPFPGMLEKVSSGRLIKTWNQKDQRE